MSGFIVMSEEKEVQEVENIEDNGKIHFPVAGLIVIGVLVALMIACVVVLLCIKGAN